MHIRYYIRKTKLSISLKISVLIVPYYLKYLIVITLLMQATLAILQILMSRAYDEYLEQTGDDEIDKPLEQWR